MFGSKEAQFVENVSTEWQMYQKEEIPRNWFVEKEGTLDNGDPFITFHQIDKYWQKVLQITDKIGQAKYSSLGRLIRIVLSLSHGQADVERGFSVNKATLRTDRNAMNQNTLVALRIVKDNVSQYDTVSDVPITKGLITAYRNAHQNYQAHLKKQREAQATATTTLVNKRKIDTEADKLEEERKKCVEDQKEAERMISEANARIAAAVKVNKFDDIRAAHALLEAGNKLLSDCRKVYQEVTTKLNAGQHQAKAKRSV